MASAPVITRIETLRNPEYQEIVWTRIYSSDGFVGLGETSFSPDAVEAYIHNDVRKYLLGKNPDNMDMHWDVLGRRMKVNRGRSVDASSVSSIDMALWDL
jgi:L-alanine-DL-glutamate epimerase-like enolase superfamily enzyme